MASMEEEEERPIRSRRGADWRRRDVVGLWGFFVVMGGLIVLAGTFLVLHNATRTSRHPQVDYGVGRVYVYRTNVSWSIPPAGRMDIVVKDIDRPPDTSSGVAIQHVRIQVLDRRTGRPLPQEQVYRYYAVLLAHPPDHHTSLDARDSPDGNGTRVLAALGPEAKETVRLPKGYFIASNPGERWMLRCRLSNSWGQVSGAGVDVFIQLNITYVPLQDALSKDMMEVHYHSLGASDVTDPSKPNGFDISSAGEGLVEWTYEETWTKPYAARIILAYGFTQIGAVRSALFEKNPTTEGGGEVEGTHLLDLIVSYEKSGLIADADRHIPMQRLLLHPNATLRVRSAFTTRPFGRVAFYWQIYVHPQASGAFR